MKILVISLAGIGDSLLATPLIRGLREACPEAQLDALVMWGGAKQILEGNPDLNTVYQENLIQAGPANGLQRLARFRHEKYDLSINTHPQGKIIYRVSAWYIHARRRLSHSYENHSFLDHQLVTDLIDQDYNIHCIENNLNFLKLLDLPLPTQTKPALYFSSEETAWTDGLARTNELQDKLVLGVHVGSGTTKNLMLKRWPTDSYIAVLRRALDAFPKLVVLLFGGPDEKTQNDAILDQLKVPRILRVPSTTMKQAAAALGLCKVYLSVDNVFMHLAATMKVPHQIVIESPTFNKTVEPYHRPYRLVRNPMVAGRNLNYYRYDGRHIAGGEEHLRACMRSITPEMVFAVLEETLRA